MRRSWQLLERDAELELLGRVAGSVEAGAGGFGIIDGVPGVGKSRLLGEVSELVPRAIVLTARGAELEQDYTFGVVRQLFEPVMGMVSPDECERLLSGAASPVRRLLFEHVDPAEPANDFPLLHGLYWLVINLCRTRPVVLLVDDLQWADLLSLRFLAYLLPRVDALPLMVVAARRSGEREVHGQLLDFIALDPAVVRISLTSLTQDGTARLLGEEFGTHAEPAFIAACHEVTGGNPLLLRELAAVMEVEGLAPTVAAIDQVVDLGRRAVGGWLSRRMAKLSSDANKLARGVALLGDGVDLGIASTWAGLDSTGGAEAAAELNRAALLRFTSRESGIRLHYTHPVLRNTVYQALDVAEVHAGHSMAMDVLREARVEPEQVAAHALLVPPGGCAEVTGVLEDAARRARLRGSPESAVTYLRRALAEPLDHVDRMRVLAQLAADAECVDLPFAAQCLEETVKLATTTDERTAQTARLAGMLVQLRRSADALPLLDEARRLSAGDHDVTQRIDALRMNIPILEPGWERLAAEAAVLGAQPSTATVGSRMLDGVLALHEANACDPAAVDRAARALSDGLLIERVNGEGALVCAWITLLAADRADAMANLDLAISHGQLNGSLRGLSPAYAFRGLALLQQGRLDAAERDLREAKRMVDTANIEIGRLFTGPFLSEVLIERGDLVGAQAALDWVKVPAPLPSGGGFHYLLLARSRILREQGRFEEALTAALSCGQRCTDLGITNPAIISWRAETALCLVRLGRTTQARSYAEDELELAERWRSPRAVGRAARIAGLVIGGGRGLELLKRSVDALEDTSARLHLAKSLIEYGRVLHENGGRDEARECLRRGVELADACDSVPLVERGRQYLWSTGARPRRLEISGIGSLTPSERKIAALTAAGRTNREIAGQLFITPKTVEIHLTAIYRKLNVRRRQELAQWSDELADTVAL